MNNVQFTIISSHNLPFCFFHEGNVLNVPQFDVLRKVVPKIVCSAKGGSSVHATEVSCFQHKPCFILLVAFRGLHVLRAAPLDCVMCNNAAIANAETFFSFKFIIFHLLWLFCKQDCSSAGCRYGVQMIFGLSSKN